MIALGQFSLAQLISHSGVARSCATTELRRAKEKGLVREIARIAGDGPGRPSKRYELLADRRDELLDELSQTHEAAAATVNMARRSGEPPSSLTTALSALDALEAQQVPADERDEVTETVERQLASASTIIARYGATPAVAEALAGARRRFDEYRHRDVPAVAAAPARIRNQSELDGPRVRTPSESAEYHDWFNRVSKWRAMAAGSIYSYSGRSLLNFDEQLDNIPKYVFLIDGVKGDDNLTRSVRYSCNIHSLAVAHFDAIDTEKSRRMDLFEGLARIVADPFAVATTVIVTIDSALRGSKGILNEVLKMGRRGRAEEVFAEAQHRLETYHRKGRDARMRLHPDSLNYADIQNNLASESPMFVKTSAAAVILLSRRLIGAGNQKTGWNLFSEPLILDRSHSPELQERLVAARAQYFPNVDQRKANEILETRVVPRVSGVMQAAASGVG